MKLIAQQLDLSNLIVTHLDTIVQSSTSVIGAGLALWAVIYGTVLCKRMALASTDYADDGDDYNADTDPDYDATYYGDYDGYYKFQDEEEEEEDRHEHKSKSWD